MGWFDHKTSPGDLSERAAEGFLKRQGLKPIAKNFRCRGGEIDLIAYDQQVLVFIEVRMRQNLKFGSGAETVTWQKQRKIQTAAQIYLQQQFQNKPPKCRFDVISMTGQPWQFEWIKNAFSL